MKHVLLLLIAHGGVALANSQNVFFVAGENQSDLNGCESHAKKKMYFVDCKVGQGEKVLTGNNWFTDCYQFCVKSERDKTCVLPLSNLT